MAQVVPAGYLTGSRFRGVRGILVTTLVTLRLRFPLETRPVEIRAIAVQLRPARAYLDECRGFASLLSLSLSACLSRM